MFSVTFGNILEILRRILSSNHTNLEHQILTVGFNPGNPPPLEESPNTNPIQITNLALNNFASNFLGVGGEVVVRGEGKVALGGEVDGEVAGGGVDGVGGDVGGE